MGKKLFASYGQNILCNPIKKKADGTVMAEVIHSSVHNLKHGDVVLYNDNDAETITLQEDIKADVIWEARIRAKLVEK